MRAASSLAVAAEEQRLKPLGGGGGGAVAVDVHYTTTAPRPALGSCAYKRLPEGLNSSFDRPRDSTTKSAVTL